MCDTKQRLFVAVHAPVDIWVNAQHVLRKDDASIFVPLKHDFAANLKKGINEVLVRFEAVKIRVGVYGMALELPETAVGAEVVLPTLLPETAERQRADRVIGGAYLDRELITAEDPVTLHWADELADSVQVSVTVSNSRGDVVARTDAIGARGAQVELAGPNRLTPGRYSVEVTPSSLKTDEIRNLCRRSLSFAAIRSDYREQPYGTFGERREEALERAAREDGLYAQIATLELGRWNDVRSEPFFQAVDKINRRNDTSDFELLGLIGVMLRYADNPSFPAALKQPIEDCILRFRYWATDEHHQESGGHQPAAVGPACRGAKDVPMLASDLRLRLPIWTEDRDYENSSASRTRTPVPLCSSRAPVSAHQTHSRQRERGAAAEFCTGSPIRYTDPTFCG